MCAIAKSTRSGAVLLVDVAGSSSITPFTTERDKKIRKLSKRHRSKKWIGADYTVTAWDEFQTVLWDRETVPYAILEVRQVLAPWDAYIGVGFGEISGWRSQKPINEALGGEGFERARAAIDAVKAARGEKFRRLTHFESGDQNRDAILNHLYGLHDTLVQQVTERQWATIGLVLDNSNQEKVATKLGVQPSTVTRNLKRGHFWQMKETATIVSGLLKDEDVAHKRAIS